MPPSAPASASTSPVRPDALAAFTATVRTRPAPTTSASIPLVTPKERLRLRKEEENRKREAELLEAGKRAFDDRRNLEEGRRKDGLELEGRRGGLGMVVGDVGSGRDGVPPRPPRR